MKTAMLSQRTADLEEIFIENTDCMFFSNKEELLSSLELLLKNDYYRESLSNSAYNKVYNDGHDVQSRMKNFLEQIQPWINKE